MWVDVLISLLSDPVRVYLLVGDILATVAVGLGIISEHGPESVRKSANWLVIGGVIAETIFSVLLFTYDGTLNFEQQSRIGALDAEVKDMMGDAKTALENEKRNAEQASNLAQENIRLWNKLADREVSGDQRAIIRHLRGGGQEITVVVSSMREPQVYGYLGKDSIAKALDAAGFKVRMDFLTTYVPPETGVVFCEIRDGDRKIYEVLREAHVVTRFIGLKDQRPDFCDTAGIEAPLEQFSHQIFLNLTVPLGHLLLKRGTLAKWHGPRIFVGQKPE